MCAGPMTLRLSAHELARRRRRVQQNGPHFRRLAASAPLAARRRRRVAWSRPRQQIQNRSQGRPHDASATPVLSANPGAHSPSTGYSTSDTACTVQICGKWLRRGAFSSCASSCGRTGTRRPPQGSAAWAWWSGRPQASSAPRPSRRRPTAAPPPPARPTRGHRTPGRAAGRRCSWSTTARRATPRSRTLSTRRRRRPRWKPRRPRSWSSTTRRRRRFTAPPASRTSPSSPERCKGCAAATCTTPMI